MATVAKEEKAALLAPTQEFAGKVKLAGESGNLAAEELDNIIWRRENIVLEGVPEGGERNCVVTNRSGEKPGVGYEPKDSLATKALTEELC